MYYLLYYVIGIAVAILSPADSTKEALAVLEPITLTALFASLLVSFAGFASQEKWQKHALKYGLVPLFGMYTVVLWEKSSITGMFLLLCASAVHAGYWMSSIHSRQYRLEQFQLGFARHRPALAELIAILNVHGRSEEADIIIFELTNGKIDDLKIVRILDGLKNKPLRERFLDEISGCGGIYKFGYRY